MQWIKNGERLHIRGQTHLNWRECVWIIASVCSAERLVHRQRFVNGRRNMYSHSAVSHPANQRSIPYVTTCSSIETSWEAHQWLIHDSFIHSFIYSFIRPHYPTWAQQMGGVVSTQTKNGNKSTRGGQTAAMAHLDPEDPRCPVIGLVIRIENSSRKSLYHSYYKKLIRRWDSERELSLRRHRTGTTKYQNNKYNGHYAVQGHSRSPILVPIESSYTTSY